MIGKKSDSLWREESGTRRMNIQVTVRGDRSSKLRAKNDNHSL